MSGELVAWWLGSGIWGILDTVGRLLRGVRATGGRRRTGRGGQDCDGGLFTARPLSGHAPSARRQQAPPPSRWSTDQTQDTMVGRNAGQTPVRDGAKILTGVTGGHGTVALELVDRTLDDRCAVCSAPGRIQVADRRGDRGVPVVGLVGGLGDGRGDLTSPQVRADRPAGVGLMGR
jgi:hypothetical protein